MLTQLINLDRSASRLTGAVEQLQRENIPFERFSAFDGKAEDLLGFAAYDGSEARRFYGRPLTSPEVGCYLSHLGCVERFLETDADLCLVVEDDFAIQEGHAKTLESLCAWALGPRSPDWELMNLGKAPRLFRTPVWEESGHTLFAAHYMPTTTTALLWNRKGAEAFLATRHQIFAPVDHFLRYLFTRRGTGFAMGPSLFKTSGAQSVINHPGTRSHERPAMFLLREGRRQGANYLHGALGKCLHYVRKRNR